MFENYRGVAWGLTAFELPCFIGFLAYFFLSAIVPAVFWGLQLLVWKHSASVQNVAIPVTFVLTLWGFLWQSTNMQWNTDRELE
jgi:hypothetical protein